MNLTILSKQRVTLRSGNVDSTLIVFKDGVLDENKGKDDELMSKSISKKLASLSDQVASQTISHSNYKLLSLDDLSKIARSKLLDKNLEVSKVRPFFWDMVETYVDRFQAFPFDAKKALFSYLESSEFPEEELRDLVKRLEKLYKKQHGRSISDAEKRSEENPDKAPELDQEISELRETLKYAAIVGERIDDEK